MRSWRRSAAEKFPEWDDHDFPRGLETPNGEAANHECRGGANVRSKRLGLALDRGVDHKPDPSRTPYTVAHPTCAVRTADAHLSEADAQNANGVRGTDQARKSTQFYKRVRNQLQDCYDQCDPPSPKRLPDTGRRCGFWSSLHQLSAGRTQRVLSAPEPPVLKFDPGSGKAAVVP
jgi:hypothetical protein